MGSREYELELVEENAVAEIQGMVVRLLEAKGISRTQLAKELDVSVPHVSQLLGAEPQNLSVRKAARLFHALGEELTFSCSTIEKLDREAYERKSQREALARLTHKSQLGLNESLWAWQSCTPKCNDDAQSCETVAA